MPKPKLALPNKGRMAEEIRELFADAGLPLSSGVNDRTLMASVGDQFDALFVRAQDIPEFVADGAADAGVTGWDLICESGRKLETLLDLGLGACRLAVAVPKDSDITSLDDIDGEPRIATAFPNLTRAFFQDRNQSVQIVPVTGAAEIVPQLGIAELVVDLVATGSTMRMNNLREIGEVLASSARLVTTQRTDALDDLVLALSSVLRARGQRYLMVNVPRDHLDEVRKVLPGLNGPTVMQLLEDTGFVAVHAIVDVSQVYRTIAELKNLGCQGIVVTRVERLVP